ncbi:MAG: 2Fe-2S iron-sulfur cluster binding domain-containing protein [Deltaproteobacteria bacterium]|nr:2Fe-2S iron-sulfur cluster binding domain-containing protein [Deltaproteobacteria bacterium]
MGGTNPYIKTPEAGQPKQKFTIEYQIQGSPEKHVVEVDPANVPTSATGLHGSILDIALAMDIDIDHACGGVCACSTCHVIVKAGLESCSESTEDEEDQLDKAPGLTPKSRLACQCVPNGTKNIVVEVPNWNRNLAREGA